MDDAPAPAAPAPPPPPQLRVLTPDDADYLRVVADVRTQQAVEIAVTAALMCA